MDALRRRVISEESGLSLLEAHTAAILIALISLAVMAAFDTARRTTFRAEQSQVASDRAQKELEAIRRLPYAEIALTATPSASSGQGDPRSRVSGTTFALDDGGGEVGELVVEGGPLLGGGTVEGAAVDPGPTPFTSGDVKGSIHRFVVWRDDPRCGESLACQGEQDLKRIVVAVAIDSTAAGGDRSYTEVQSDVVDPNDSAFGDGVPPDLGDQVVAQQFWLSDERCTNTGEPTHTDPLDSHPVRDTLGNDCRAETDDRPDALLTAAPVNLDPTVDFATDADLEPDPPGLPEDDAGLQFELGGSDGCNFKPGGPNGHQQAHIWVSRSLPFDFDLAGGATLELWTRTTNAIETPGRVCASLFTRLEDQSVGQPPDDQRLEDVDNPGNRFFTQELAPWPNDPGWSRIRIPMSFTPTTAFGGTRIGVAVSLDKGGSPSDQLEFMYDQVQFESRLEVETATPLTP